jgi:phage gpG-like protein
MGNKFGLDKLKQEIGKLQVTLPKKLADESRAHFIKSFESQGFTNQSLQKWPEVQRRTPETNAYKYPKKKNLSRRTKEILVKTGRLKRSPRIVSISKNSAVITSDVPYAKYLNTRFKFMGRSRVLDKKCTEIIEKEIMNAIKMSRK